MEGGKREGGKREGGKERWREGRESIIKRLCSPIADMAKCKSTITCRIHHTDKTDG